MVHIGAEANVREINERAKYANRPINVHMVKCLTVLGLRIQAIRQSTQVESPRTARVVADTWAKTHMSKHESVTIWTD